MSGNTRAPDFLNRMAEASRRRLRAARARIGVAQMQRMAAERPPPPALRLSPDGFDLIAEVKFRAPSVGTLASRQLDPSAQASGYAKGGAAAISVLTEPEEFHGDLAHLETVAAGFPDLPIMRKDFLVSPYQVLEGRAAGAAGVLVVVAMLSDQEISDLLETAFNYGMFVLVEAFDEADIERALPLMRAAGEPVRDGTCRMLIGVNCRDLRTLGVDFQRFERLAAGLPRDIPRVAESGVESPAQVQELAALGYQLALVGTALMRAADPSAAARALLAGGRGHRPCSSRSAV